MVVVLSGNVDQVDIVCLSNIEDWVTNKVYKSSHTYVKTVVTALHMFNGELGKTICWFLSR